MNTQNTTDNTRLQFARKNARDALLEIQKSIKRANDEVNRKIEEFDNAVDNDATQMHALMDTMTCVSGHLLSNVRLDLLMRAYADLASYKK